MKTANYKSLGLVVNLSVPESVEEFDANAKRVGACLEEATNNCVYRGSLAEFRDKFCTKLAEKYGVDRLEKPTGKKDAEGKDITVYDETEGDYVARVIALKSISAEDLQALANEIASGIVFDASARERKAPTPKKLAQKWLDAAKTIIDNGKVDAFNTKLSKMLGKTFTPLDDATASQLALGTLIREYFEENEKQNIAKMVA